MMVFAFTKLISRWFVHPKKTVPKETWHYLDSSVFWHFDITIWWSGKPTVLVPDPYNTTELTAAGLIQQIRQVSTTHALQKTNTVDRSHHCAVCRKFSGKVVEKLWKDYDLRGKVGVGTIPTIFKAIHWKIHINVAKKHRKTTPRAISLIPVLIRSSFSLASR